MYQVNYTVQKAWKALHLVMRVLKKGNMKTECLAYTSLVRPILEYESACWDPCREGQINALDRVQKRAAQFTNHTKDSDCETLAQRRMIEDLCALFNPYPTAFPYGNGMVLHFYQQQESSTTKTVHKVINKGLKTYV